MALPLPPDCDAADAQRLARLVLCERCTSANPPSLPHRPEPRAVRLPYADD
jgi:hypothetical protein